MKRISLKSLSCCHPPSLLCCLPATVCKDSFVVHSRAFAAAFSLVAACFHNQIVVFNMACCFKKNHCIVTKDEESFFCVGLDITASENIFKSIEASISQTVIKDHSRDGKLHK